MNDHIVLSHVFDGKGGATPFDSENISVKDKSKNLKWVNLDATHPDTRTWLQSEISHLDLFITEALMEDETRPRMTQINDGVLLILRGVNLNDNADPEDMVSIRLWVDEHRIISVRKRRLKTVVDISEKLKLGKGPKNSGEFVCMLVSGLFAKMGPVLTALDETTDNVEEQILENADKSLREAITGIRKDAIMLRRYMAPQRDAIGQLRMCDVDWLSDTNKRQLQEAYNNVTRYVEDLDAIRERAQIVKDELTNILADRLNKNMYILSVIAAIFLPLGFLTGLLGINVGGLPGANNDYAFAMFSLILVFLVFMQVLIFKKLKWF
jgi:zinc transporter